MLFGWSKFQKHVWRLVCPEIEKISFSYDPTFLWKKVATNNFRSSEKCFGAGNMPKIIFCCSSLLDFYAKIMEIDVFLMVSSTSWLFRSSWGFLFFPKLRHFIFSEAFYFFLPRYVIWMFPCAQITLRKFFRPPPTHTHSGRRSDSPRGGRHRVKSGEGSGGGSAPSEITSQGVKMFQKNVLEKKKKIGSDDFFLFWIFWGPPFFFPKNSNAPKVTFCVGYSYRAYYPK